MSSEMVAVTPEDREAAVSYLFSYASDVERTGAGWVGDDCRWLLSGQNDSDRTIQALARHRIAERERCAKVADRVADAILGLVSEQGTVTDARAAAHLAAESIANTIRENAHVE